MANMIRVMCVDDHRIVRDGLELIIASQPDMAMVATAADAAEAVEMCRRFRPDVTLMDLRLRGMSGIDAIRAIKREFHDARIIVLTMYEGDEDIHQALRAGAVTYLLKDTISADLVRIIREVYAGGRPLPLAVAARLAERTSLPALTRREVEILNMLAQGLRNKEIAAALGRQETTIQVHIKNLFAKLSVKDRTAAVTVGLQRGIIHLGQ
jgi:DNA-binding NarL/FixJ family response regulator